MYHFNGNVSKYMLFYGNACSEFCRTDLCRPVPYVYILALNIEIFLFYVGIHYDIADFALKNNFNALSNFGSVDFTVYSVLEVFGIYGTEVVFSTPNETAQCALATAFYSEYTGVTEIVNL